MKNEIHNYRSAALRAGVILLAVLLAIMLLWRFCYENKYERMINTYIEYIENEMAFDPDSLLITDVEFIEEGFPNETWTCAEGWYPALITYYCIDDVYGGATMDTVHLYYNDDAGVCRGYSYWPLGGAPAGTVLLKDLTDQLHTYKIDHWGPDEPQVVKLKKNIDFQLPAEWGDFNEILSFDDEKIVFADYGENFTSEENDIAQLIAYLTPDESTGIQEKVTYTYAFEEGFDFKTSTYSIVKKGDAIFFPVQEPEDAVMKIDLKTGELSTLCTLDIDTDKAWVRTLGDRLVLLCDKTVSSYGSSSDASSSSDLNSNTGSVVQHWVIVVDQASGEKETVLVASHDEKSGTCICGMDTGLGKIHLLTAEVNESDASYFADILTTDGQFIAHEKKTHSIRNTSRVMQNPKLPCSLDWTLDFRCTRGFKQIQANCSYDIIVRDENNSESSISFPLYFVSEELYDEWMGSVIN